MQTLSQSVEQATASFTPEQEKALIELIKERLDLEAKSQALKESRSRRFWGAVGGLAAATTALVGLFSYIRRER